MSKKLSKPRVSDAEAKAIDAVIAAIAALPDSIQVETDEDDMEVLFFKSPEPGVTFCVKTFCSERVKALP